jgi:hypothetical protein
MPEKQEIQEYPQGSIIPKINDEVGLFVQHINSLQSSISPVMLTLETTKQDIDKMLLKYAEKYGEMTEKTEKSITYSFRPPYDNRAARFKKKTEEADTANKIVPRVFVLALVSQFDAFLGRLLRVLFLLRPELITSSDRSLTLAQLLELGSIESATEFLLEKEIETVLRKSHGDQFAWMESKFSVKLREGLDSWPTFIEVTERRNLFAHSNGLVSDQYLAVCKNNGVCLPDETVRGLELQVDPKYFSTAYACILEIGVKLSQVLWRKLRPDQINEADNNLIGISFDLIVAGRFILACNILDFACNVLKKHGSEQNRKILTINRAQAYKWSGNADKCLDIINREDWSASGAPFHLAVAVLKDDFKKAKSWMQNIGKSGEVKESDYHEWPLFKEFRKTKEFATTYASIFGKDFVYIEEVLRAQEKERRREVLQELREAFEKEEEEGASQASNERSDRDNLDSGLHS